MCVKCLYQSQNDGICTNLLSNNYGAICPGIDYGADVNDCEVAKVLPCKDNVCEKCNGVPHEEKDSSKKSDG